MRIIQFNEEVLFTDADLVKVGYQEILMLKNRANSNRRKRIRLCSHRDTSDKIHEMIIVHKQGTYVRPHKHLNKSESFHIIEGEVDLILYNEEGEIHNVTHMGDYISKEYFYYRIAASCYHSLLIKSEFLVFHETTNGPFIREDTIFPTWAPNENEHQGQEEFLNKLTQKVNLFRECNEK
jgi:cupin fold WbuC family metalloprotein